jgi:Alginate lyase
MTLTKCIQLTLRTKIHLISFTLLALIMTLSFVLPNTYNIAHGAYVKAAPIRGGLILNDPKLKAELVVKRRGQFILGPLINGNPNYVYAKSQIPNSSSLPAAVTASNGKMLSRALLLDRPLLDDIIKAIKNNTDSILQNSLKELLMQANSFLNLNPKSVIEKSQIPSSGNKHDFLSLAPYRWPDPSKPNGLPYIHRGIVNPEIYSIPDKKNLEDMIYRVKILSLAYYLTDNSSYAFKAGQLLRVWFLNNGTKMNPNLQHAEMERGINDGSRSGIMNGKDLPGVIDAIELIGHSSSWSNHDQQGMKLWFSRYLDWLLNSMHGKQEQLRLDNHGTWYAVQVSSIALFLNKTDISKSTVQGTILHRLIPTQIEPDGRQPLELTRTHSLDYSIFNLLGLFKLADLAQHLGIDLWNYKTTQGAGLQKALDYLLPYILKKQGWPYLQIEPVNIKNLVDLLCRAEVHYQNNHSYMQACNYVSTERIDPARIFPP